MAVAITAIWSSIPGLWRWVVVGLIAYSVIVTPFILAQTLRAYWHGSEAAQKNRQLIVLEQGERRAADT